MNPTFPKTIANSKTPLSEEVIGIALEAAQATANEKTKKTPVARSRVSAPARRAGVKGTCMEAMISAGMVMLMRSPESPRVARGSMIFVETAT